MRELILIQINLVKIADIDSIKLEFFYNDSVERIIYCKEEIDNILGEIKKALLEQPT